MVSLKSEELEDYEPLTASPARTRDELKLWEKLTFTFDMDREPSGSSRAHHTSRTNQRSRSDSASVQSGGANTSALQDAALLAQFAAAANHGGMDVNHAFPPVLPPGQYPSLGPAPAFYGNFFHHDGMPPANQLPSLSTMDFPWPNMSSPPQHHSSLPYHTHPHSPSISTMSSSSPTSTFVPSPYPVPPLPPPQESSSSRSGRGRSASATEDLTEGERIAIAEEKRRRNTAASARFRIKKKAKTVNLERSVSDLSGRAEELEREVSDLRRENGWLKEIVMLKGTRFAAANMSHRAALNQAAALALGGQQPGGPVASSSQSFAEGSGQRHTEEVSEEESESSDEEDAPTTTKGKGDSSGRK
ncbi:hypothetical protein MD484_g185, partial [Candolleomyces efflorescens]